MKKRKHFLITGYVQGVGFRYRAKIAAEYLGLTGYVCNLPDGSVEMEVQGEETLIYQQLERIQEGHYVEISSIESKDMPLSKKERGFHAF